VTKISGSKAWSIQVLSMSGEMVIPVQSRVGVPKPQELLVGRIDHKGNDK